MFKAKGQIIYDPKSDKADRKGFQFWWCKLDVPDNIIHYYQYWVRRELGIMLNAPIWRAHVSVIRGEAPKKEREFMWKRHANEVVEFEYGEDIRMSETYMWIPVYCDRLKEIRAELGLRPEPRVDFHITIGNRKNLGEVKMPAPTMPFRLFPWEEAENVDFLWKRYQRKQSKKKYASNKIQ